MKEAFKEEVKGAGYFVDNRQLVPESKEMISELEQGW
jgi:hypothetical protein